MPLLLSVLLSSSLAKAQNVRIGVLGIFHPHQLTLAACEGDAIVVTAGGQTLFLQPRSSTDSLEIRASGDVLVLGYAGKEIRARDIHAAGRNRDTTDFVLSVPGKIARRYRGTLGVTIVDGVLVAVVAMDLETAVASVVHAESLANTPLEALKAQILHQQPVRCDEVAWSLWGVSLAGWNLLARPNATRPDRRRRRSRLIIDNLTRCPPCGPSPSVAAPSDDHRDGRSGG